MTLSGALNWPQNLSPPRRTRSGGSRASTLHPKGNPKQRSANNPFFSIIRKGKEEKQKAQILMGQNANPKPKQTFVAFRCQGAKPITSDNSASIEGIELYST